MADKERKRLSASVRFEFTGVTKKQKTLFFVQLAIILGFVIAEIVTLVVFGPVTTHILLLLLWIAGGAYLIRNMRAVTSEAAAKKAKENRIPEMELVTPVPEQPNNSVIESQTEEERPGGQDLTDDGVGS